MIVRSVSSASRRTVTVSKVLAIGLIAGGILGAAALPADDNVGNTVSQAVQGVFNKSKGAIVKIEGTDMHDHVLAGTGFFIDPNGMIYTSYAVGGDTDGIVVQYGDKKYPAKRLLGDPRSGIAILKIDARTPFLQVSKSGDPAVATPVLVLGYPMDLPITPSLGVVAGIDSGNDEGTFVTRHIRANVSVKPGQAGAPMLNLNGELVGIVVSSGDESGASCYALPVEAMQKVRSDYDRFGEIHHGWIGIGIAKAGAPSGGSTAVISNLIDESPAAKSGLKSGDFVLQIGTKTITAPEDVFNASFFLTAGDDVAITILRGPQKMVVKVQAASEEQPPMETPMNVQDFSSGGFPLETPH